MRPVSLVVIQYLTYTSFAMKMYKYIYLVGGDGLEGIPVHVSEKGAHLAQGVVGPGAGLTVGRFHLGLKSTLLGGVGEGARGRLQISSLNTIYNTC